MFSCKCTAYMPRQNVPKLSFNSGPNHQKNILENATRNIHRPKPEKIVWVQGPEPKRKIGGTGSRTGKTGIEKGPGPEKNLLIEGPRPEKRFYRGPDRKNAL